jgi:hypothetical protein
MALSPSEQDRELAKFVETSDGKTAIRTISFGNLIPPNAKYGSCAYPDATTEVYTFKTSSTGTTLGTLTVVYTDSTKEVLSTFEFVDAI